MAALKQHALGLPEAVEEFPWAESAFKVAKKTFAFLHARPDADGGFSLTVKLPVSAEMAVTLPFAEPAGYGLGRSGWVTCVFRGDDDPPLDMLIEWLEQSYRAVAPKKLAKAVPPRSG